MGRARYANIKYHNGKFVSSNNHLITSKDKNEILGKYLFFFIESNAEKFYIPTSTYPKFDSDIFSNFKIPIPPIPVQEEIVRILDTFTSLQTSLQTELELRKKQYTYYRDKLLDFENDRGIDVEYKKLGDVMALEYGKNLPQSKRIEGNYKVYGSNGIVGSHNTFFVTAPVIIIGRKGSAGKINFVEENCCPIDTAFYSVMKTNDNLKFIFYYLQILNLEKMRVEGGVPGINRNDLYNISIPIPPLEEQKRIVEILDKFDRLVNDISIGIPAEIKMRKKQYTYYRDKLLSFEGA